MLDIRTNENETKKYFAEKEAYEKYYKDKPFYSESTHIQALMLDMMKEPEKHKTTPAEFCVWLIVYGIFIVVFVQACGT